MSDPDARKLYDAQLSNEALSQDSTQWCTVSLAEMLCTKENVENVYTLACKCSGTYEVDQQQERGLMCINCTDILFLYVKLPYEPVCQ